MNRPKIVLEGAVKNKRVASAYLFMGGGSSTAFDFANILACKKQDVFFVSPKGKSLGIEQIRELSSWVRYGPSVSNYLLAIIERADEMTAEASAAFLKTLEEPAGGVVFVLLAEREEKLPETIRSRCQKILFSEEARAWQPKKEYQPLCQEFGRLPKKSMVELLGLSQRLSREKERIEELLYELVNCFRDKPSLARIILDTIRSIKKRANLRLSLDVMCLRLVKHGKEISYSA